jgi:trehalose 6-phosphate phosphatase
MPDAVEPPPLDSLRHALFLDFDGSLVEFALTPDRIVVLPETIALLASASKSLQGALAIVSGRQISDIDRHLAPLRLPVSGVHGLEFRNTGETMKVTISGELQRARRRLSSHIGADDPIFMEDKGGALVLHYRAHPDQRTRAEALAREAVVGLDTLSVIGGHSIFEIRQRDITKADAVDRFMAIPPFGGRTPVFVGDDLTDEDGMRAAANRGGFGVRIGPGKSAAAYRLADTHAVHRWISLLAGSSPPPGTVAVQQR